ncbi:MAG: hypothetical protein WBD22_03640 [Pyrinomonadaceae bacterium]
MSGNRTPLIVNLTVSGAYHVLQLLARLLQLLALLFPPSAYLLYPLGHSQAGSPRSGGLCSPATCVPRHAQTDSLIVASVFLTFFDLRFKLLYFLFHSGDSHERLALIFIERLDGRAPPTAWVNTRSKNKNFVRSLLDV